MLDDDDWLLLAEVLLFVTIGLEPYDLGSRSMPRIVKPEGVERRIAE